MIALASAALPACGTDPDPCPVGRAAASGLELAPAAGLAVPLHAHGTKTTWQWQLSGTLDTGYAVDVYDVDLFETTEAQIGALHDQGRRVVCYFSAGSSESWRDDFGAFEPEDLGKHLDGWEKERWLDIRSKNVLRIMEARLDLAVRKGCDGVEPDNMDAYDQRTCFEIGQDDQLAYNRAIANLARARGLSVGLKNDPEQVAQLVDYFDFSVSEECYQYEECASYRPFTSQDKPVFNAEYKRRYRKDPERSALCSASQAEDIRTLILDLELDNRFRASCDP